MRQTNQTRSDPPVASSDREIWQYCRTIAAAPDEAARLLDLAGFADARLDADEHERVAALIAADADAAADVAAAQAITAGAIAGAPATAALDRVVARAAALVDAGPPERGQVIPFLRAARPSVYGVARWGSLAAAIVMASWLGFALGSATPLALNQTAVQSSDDNFLTDLLDPAGGLLANITNGLEIVTVATSGPVAETRPPRRRRLLIALLILSAVLNLCFVGGALWRRVHAPLAPAERIQAIAGELNLNPQQRIAFDHYFRTMRARARVMHAQLAPIITDAWAEIAKPQPDRARITQLFDAAAAKRHDFARDATAGTMGFLATLSPSQRAEFVTLLREHRRRWMHH